MRPNWCRCRREGRGAGGDAPEGSAVIGEPRPHRAAESEAEAGGEEEEKVEEKKNKKRRQ